MKALRWCFLVFFIAEFSVGCSNSSTNATGDLTMQSLFPLNIGNTWSYKELDFDNNGNPTDSSIQTASVVSSEVIGANLVFTVIAYSPTGSPSTIDTTRLYFAEGGRVMYPYFDPASAPGNQGWLFRYPMLSGDSTVIIDSAYASGRRYRAVEHLIGTNVSVTVGAGTFSCYKFERSAYNQSSSGLPFILTAVEDFYFAPGVGLVRDYVEYYQNGVLTPEFDVTLQSYSVK